MSRISTGALLAMILAPAPGAAQETTKVFVADLPLFEQTRIEVEKLERETEAADLLREARAAERTLIHGDVVQATRNFIRAAMAAEEAGNRLRAVELGWKAYHLIKSPVLSERDRNDLQRHFELATG